MAEIFAKTVVDCETGEQKIVKLTDDEIKEVLARRAEAEANLKAIEEEKAKMEAAKASALAKLAALGLTEEEAKAIAG